MFSLRDLRFVLCSRDLDVLRAQRIIGFFILITHKSPRSENLITWVHYNHSSYLTIDLEFKVLIDIILIHSIFDL